MHLYPLVGEVVLFLPLPFQLPLVSMSESQFYVVFAFLLVHLLYCFVEQRLTFALGLGFSGVLTWMEITLKLERVEVRILQDHLQQFHRSQTISEIRAMSVGYDSAASGICPGQEEAVVSQC